MKNTVGKGIVFYLFILIAIILGVICLIASIMVFSPGTSIFGFCYFKHNVNQFVANYKVVNNYEYAGSIHEGIENGQIKKIVLNTDFFNILVKQSDVGALGFTIKDTTNAISKTPKNIDLSHTCEFNPELNTLTFTINETPALFYFSKDASITFNIPENKNINNLDLEFNTTSGTVHLANAKNQNFSVNNITANINNGSIITGTEFKMNESAFLKITSTSGTINLKNTISSSVDIISKSGPIEITHITKNLSLRTESSIIKLGNIDGNLLYDARKGTLNANKIGNDFNCSENVALSTIKISEILGSTLIPNADNSNISIGKTVGNVFIKTISGNVTLGEITANANIETDTGNIRYTANNTSKNQITITTRAGDINGTYLKVNGLSSIINVKGDIFIMFATPANFDLEYECLKNKPTITQGIFAGEYEKTGMFHIGHIGTEPESKIVVKNTEGNTGFSDILE